MAKKAKKVVPETPTMRVVATLEQTHELMGAACAPLSGPELEILINLARMMEWARIGQQSRGLIPTPKPRRSKA